MMVDQRQDAAVDEWKTKFDGASHAQAFLPLVTQREIQKSL